MIDLSFMKGIDDFHLERLTAFARPEYVASIRVLAKSRFRERQGDSIMGIKTILFSVDAK